MATKRTIDILRTALQSDYFTDSAVASVFSNSTGLHNKVSRLLKSGDIIQLKKGFYVFGNEFRIQSLNVYPASLIFNKKMSEDSWASEILAKPS